MKRKKILFVNGHMKYGGIEKSLLDILRNFNYNKYEVDLLLIEGKGDYFSEIPAEVNVIFKDLTNTEGAFFKSVINSFFKKDFLSFFARIIFLGRKYFNSNILKLLRVPLLGIKKYDFAIAYRPGICTDLIQYAVESQQKTTWWHHGELKLLENNFWNSKKHVLLYKIL